MACSSSDESTALSEWFGDQGLATSYGKEFKEIDVSIESFSLQADTSAYAIGSYAALGNVNGIEHMLFLGMDSLPSKTWNLKADTVFYKDIYSGEIPVQQLEATIYWLEETEELHDSTWLKFDRPWKDSADISIDNFSISLPENVPNSKLLIGIKLKPGSNTVLRINSKSINNTDMPGLLRVAQKTNITDNCLQCLHAGARESLQVSLSDFSIDKTVVFAQLVFPAQSDTAGSELGLPVPVYVYGTDGLENYRVDTAYVNANKLHPNLVFSEVDTLKLQVTNSLRKGNINFTIRLGTPMLIPGSFFFYNSVYSSEKVFSDRPAYARYDFSAIEKGKTVKLRLWFADYGDKK